MTAHIVSMRISLAAILSALLGVAQLAAAAPVEQTEAVAMAASNASTVQLGPIRMCGPERSIVLRTVSPAEMAQMVALSAAPYYKRFPFEKTGKSIGPIKAVMRPMMAKPRTRAQEAELCILQEELSALTKHVYMDGPFKASAEPVYYRRN